MYPDRDWIKRCNHIIFLAAAGFYSIFSAFLFRWDPVFQPADYQLTYAEMDADTKNSISHRGRALQKLIQHFVTKP
jgi:hypothetical protein